MSAPDHQFNSGNSNPMAEVLTSGAFRLSISPSPHQKRKRRSDHLDDENDSFFGARDAKRRTTAVHSLPIRLSPGRPNHSTSPGRSLSLYTSIYQQPPTPVDTSDEESPGLPTKHSDNWHLATSDCQSTNDAGTSLSRSPSGNVDVDMDMAAPLVVPRIRRARSNDIIPPARDATVLSAMEMFARERVPTPINTHFDSRVNELPNVPRHQFPPLRTNLSPMIEQESWISRDGLPSPVEDEDEDMMDRDDSNGINDFGGGKYGLDAQTSPSGRTRTGRLHMGFLHDCEKCVMKVPGHYSHIIWS